MYFRKMHDSLSNVDRPHFLTAEGGVSQCLEEDCKYIGRCCVCGRAQISHVVVVKDQKISAGNFQRTMYE